MRRPVHINASHSSRFGWVAAGCQSGPLPTFDEPLVADAHAVALPSLGSLVEGWTLIIPRTASPNLRGLGGDGRSRLESIRRLVVDKLMAQTHRDLFEFEHGAESFGSPVGCGVDHAHLHVVPLPFDLIHAVQRLPHGRSVLVAADHQEVWNHVPGSGDYLMVRNVHSGMAIVLMVETPESQVIRKLIASELGRPEEWNYRTCDGLKNALRTRSAFGNVVSEFG